MKEKETKGAQKKKSLTEEVLEAEDDEENSNEDIVYAASSDEIVLEARNVCAACDGNEDWDIDEKWIGCVS